MRTKRIGLQKNACVALGNRRDTSAVPSLISTLTNAEPIVRGHAAWALGEISTCEALSALEIAAESETDSYVLEEIQEAIKVAVDPVRSITLG